MSGVQPSSRLAHARNQFPGTATQIYLETSARGLMPRAALEGALTYYEAAVRGAPKESGGVFAAVERSRERFAHLIHATANEVTLTRNVSEGLNMIVASLSWREGDNAIVCRDIEHPNGVYALYNMRDRHGIEVRIVKATPDLAMPIDAIEQSIDARTRLVILSSVTFATGARTELDRIGRTCRERNVILLVDGAQSVGALDLDVHAANIDALAVGASKYLCGPYGLGFLFVRCAFAEQLRPAYLGRYSINLGDAHEGEQGDEKYRLMPGARRFDLGSYNYAAANAVEASLDILTTVGVPIIEKHITALSQRLDAELRAMNVPLVSGSVAKHRSHIVVAGWEKTSPEGGRLINELANHYAHNDIRVSERLGRLRLSFHLYNTPEEVDAVIAATRKWPHLKELTSFNLES